MDNAVKGGLLNAGGTLLGSLVNGLFNFFGSREQRSFEEQQAAQQMAWNEQMQEKQNAWSLDMWNKTNEYNSPVEQRKRLEEAGLNPLYYGLDGSSANGLESAQVHGYDRPSALSIGNPYAGFNFDKALQIAQISNIQANTAKTGQETLTEVQRRENMIAEFDNLKQTFSNLLAQEKLTDAQRNQIELAMSWVDRLNEANLAKTEIETKLNQAQIDKILSLLPSEVKFNEMNINNFDYKWREIESIIGRNLSEIQKLNADVTLTEQDIANYALNHFSNGAFGTGVSWQNLERWFGPQWESLKKRAKGYINQVKDTFRQQTQGNIPWQ